jgi:carbonic anhydrase
LAVAQHLPKVPADQIWNMLSAGSHRFVIGKTETHDFVAQRQAVAKSQHSQVAVLSCSDSRVPPELVFDAGLDELFVVRSAGEDDDPLAIGSLEYAVENLGSTVIVVNGSSKLRCCDCSLCRWKV